MRSFTFTTSISNGAAAMEPEKSEKNDMEELEREIRKTIADNSRFLEKVLDDDFEPEEEEEETGGEPVEEL
jgi:hypothetical protein